MCLVHIDKAGGRPLDNGRRWRAGLVAQSVDGETPAHRWMDGGNGSINFYIDYGKPDQLQGRIAVGKLRNVARERLIDCKSWWDVN